MRRIKIDDAELSADIVGRGDPVLLVSGLGGRASFWKRQVGPFSEHFTVITHDHRGTGNSTKSRINYSVSQIAEDALQLMDSLGIEKAHYVGHSTGGAVGQYIAINHPERLRRLVLSATWCGPTPYFGSQFELRRHILDQCGPEAYQIDGILRAFPPSYLIEHPELLTDSRTDRSAAFPGHEIERSRIAAVLGHDQRSHLSSIDAPTLVICADDDVITPPPLSKELAEGIPGAQVTVLPFGGHFVPQISSTSYNHKVLSFLTDRPQEIT